MNDIYHHLLLANWWTDMVSNLDSGERTGLLIVAIGCGTGVILGLAGILHASVNSIHRRRSEVAFKRELIERGMTADEIVQIIECAPPLENATERWIASWAKPTKKTG